MFCGVVEIGASLVIETSIDVPFKLEWSATLLMFEESINILSLFIIAFLLILFPIILPVKLLVKIIIKSLLVLTSRIFFITSISLLTSIIDCFLTEKSLIYFENSFLPILIIIFCGVVEMLTSSFIETSIFTSFKFTWPIKVLIFVTIFYWLLAIILQLELFASSIIFSLVVLSFKILDNFSKSFSSLVSSLLRSTIGTVIEVVNIVNVVPNKSIFFVFDNFIISFIFWNYKMSLCKKKKSSFSELKSLF